MEFCRILAACMARQLDVCDLADKPEVPTRANPGHRALPGADGSKDGYCSVFSEVAGSHGCVAAADLFGYK